MFKKIMIITGWVFCSAAIIFFSAFAEMQHSKRPVAGVDVRINRKAEHFFITEDEIKTSLIARGFGLPNQTLSAVDIPAIERLINAHSAVQSCEACVNVEGKVLINIIQRKPIARLINLSGESYYFDDMGRLMPWSDKYTAPVILVNGFFIDSYAAMSSVDFNAIPADSASRSVTLLDDIWQVVKHIDSDSFLRVQMVQVYVSQENGFELVPRVGNQKIILGTSDGIPGKFKKLSLFYTYGLNQTSRWNDYCVIDLRFKNQIVCTKNPIANGI